MIYILLSCFNGSKNLNGLLSSLASQTIWSECKLLVRDDCSTDNTLEIVRNFEKKHLGKVIVFQGYKNVGVKESFFFLLDQVPDGSPFLFCDQDDVWYPKKIESLCSILALSKNSANDAICVIQDMRVVSENKCVISESFWEFQKIPIWIRNDVTALIGNNILTGASALFNGRCRSLILKNKDLPLLHDHISAISVCERGLILVDHNAGMDYVQHSTNVLGASRFGPLYMFQKFLDFSANSIPSYKAASRRFGVRFSSVIWKKFWITLRRFFGRSFSRDNGKWSVR